MDNIRAAASFFGTPAKVTCSSDIRIRDEQLSVELHATGAFTTGRIEGPERDGMMILMRLSPTSANITLDEAASGANIKHSGAGTVIMTAGDSAIYRYCKAHGYWHELKRVAH